MTTKETNKGTENADGKRNRYSDHSAEKRDRYEQPPLSNLHTDVIARPGYRTYWARESEVNFRLREGYEIVQNIDDSVSMYVSKSQDPNNNSSCYRLPTRDNDEDLILLEIPIDKWETLRAPDRARADNFEKALNSKTFKDGNRGDFEQVSNITHG